MAINDYILELYRASRRLPHSQFQQWVFEGLSRLVQFDSAFWFRGVTLENRAQAHAAYLYRQPETLLQEYVERELWRDDEIYLRALTVPSGTAVRVSFDNYASAKMRDFLRRNRQHHLMNITLVQEVPQIVSGISLYRDETRLPFSDEDAAVQEALAPHIIDAWRENWLADVVQSSRSIRPTEFSLGSLMPDMMLSEAQHNLASLLLLEWPDWRGPWLPQALHRHVVESASPGQPWVGKAITVYHRVEQNRSTLILVRPRHAMDGLSRRKREAALLFAGGASQTEVANRLKLSASTVNNYLGEVYRALGIRDKTDLSVLASRLEP